MTLRKQNRPPSAMFRIITVRKTILAAARKLEQLAQSEGEPSALLRAEEKMNEARRSDDRAGLHFWRSVWIHMMSMQHAEGEVCVIESEEPIQNISEARH